MRLLENNGHELWRAVHYLTKDQRSLLLGGILAKRERDQWLEEVGRRLHNVVAAVKTVVDHTRKLNKDLYGNAKATAHLRKPGKHRGSVEYARHLRALVDDPLVSFVQQLRNVFVHSTLPSIWWVEEMGDEHGPTRSIALNRDDLLASAQWTRRARDYLKSRSEDIDIGAVVDSYLKAVRTFHAWFAENLEKVHAEDYAAVNAKLAAISRARAPEVFASLRGSIAQVEAGTTTAYEAIGQWLSYNDEALLEQMRNDLPSWVACALYHLAQQYGDIPQDIVTRFQNAARAR